MESFVCRYIFVGPVSDSIVGSSGPFWEALAAFGYDLTAFWHALGVHQGPKKETAKPLTKCAGGYPEIKNFGKRNVCGDPGEGQNGRTRPVCR